MFRRALKCPKRNSFFVFGPRGSGKTTWLRQQFKDAPVLWFDLLEAKTDLELKRDPDLVLKRWLALAERPGTIVIDEVQKIPALLDVVHKGIEEHNIQFVLTGSSARKLKRGSANLLAGRAFEFFLYPFSCFELGSSFDLPTALQFGLLPKIYSPDMVDPLDKERYLYSYVSTYLKEEILVEQIVRRLDPFQKFLEIAAQSNGKIINYAKLGRDAGIDPKQVERYFPILGETMVGFFLEPYHRSLRKRQAQKAKFYFFDPGVARALSNRLSIVPSRGTYEYGDVFEHFLMLEFFKLNLYLEKRFKFSYFRSDNDLEIDLIIEKPGQPVTLVEMKSSDKVDLDEVSKLARLSNEFRNANVFYLSEDTQERFENKVLCLHWKEGLKRIFGI